LPSTPTFLLHCLTIRPFPPFFIESPLLLHDAPSSRGDVDPRLTIPLALSLSLVVLSDRAHVLLNCVPSSSESALLTALTLRTPWVTAGPSLIQFCSLSSIFAVGSFVLRTPKPPKLGFPNALTVLRLLPLSRALETANNLTFLALRHLLDICLIHPPRCRTPPSFPVHAETTTPVLLFTH